MILLLLLQNYSLQKSKIKKRCWSRAFRIFAAELAVMSSLKHSIIFLILYLLNLLYLMPYTIHLRHDDGPEPRFLEG